MSTTSEPVLRRINSLMQLRQEVEALDAGTPWVPPIDWIETDTDLLLLMDAPGLDAESFELVEEDGNVTVAGTRLPFDLGGTLLVGERPHGTFQRSLRIPVETIPGTGEAQMRGGVLIVKFEKRHKIIDQE